MIATVACGMFLAAPAAHAETADEKSAAAAAVGHVTWKNINSGQCLGVLNGNMTNGTPVIQWPCNGNPDQEWTVPPIPSHGVFGEMRNMQNNNKCLGVKNGSLDAGATLLIWDCNGNPDQKWAIDIVGTGGQGFTILNYNAALNGLPYVADVAEASRSNGAPVVIWPYAGRANQRWN
jgi:hypothetical protein